MHRIVAYAIRYIPWILVFVIVAGWFGVFSETSFNKIHFYYEPLWIKFLLILNFPALIVVGFVAFPIISLLPADTGDIDTVIPNFLVIAASSLQWFAIGKIIRQYIYRLGKKRL